MQDTTTQTSVRLGSDDEVHNDDNLGVKNIALGCVRLKQDAIKRPRVKSKKMEETNKIDSYMFSRGGYTLQEIYSS